MSDRTPAQYRADLRRSHKAKAKREQKVVAVVQSHIAHMLNSGLYIHSGVDQWREAQAISARMARCHLNFLLIGKYEDFV